MGYEAYKITAKFQNLSVEDMMSALRDSGALLIEKFGGTVTMEIANSTGVIELVLREESHINLRFSPWQKVLLNVRFAKANDMRLIGDVITLLKKLNAEFDAVYIRDRETNRDIDLNNTGCLIKAVTYAKYDFEYYYPAARHNVRCRDMFCLCGNDYPRACAEEMN